MPFTNKSYITWAALLGCFFIFACVNDEKKVEALFEKNLVSTKLQVLTVT
jgi:hypothetical protein